MTESPSAPDPLAQFARTIDLLGAAGFARLQRSFVAVIGLGGVGGHAAVALVRSGIGRLRLVDFDRVTASSLNRSAFATVADVGQPKALVLRTWLAAIAPTAAVETAERFFHEESADELLAGPPDFVIDAIDSFTPKVALLRACLARELPVLCCLGASARTDPTLLRLGDIDETSVCPLARAVRRRLRHHGIRGGIPALYSLEPPRHPLPPDEADETLRRGRVRQRLPSLGIMPGIFGHAAAGYVIEQLTASAAVGAVIEE